MSESHLLHPDEVEHLLRNAQLRDDLEPFCDESLDTLNLRHVPTPVENEFLASMLAWERAPVLPISKWFDPELCLSPPEALDDQQLRAVLWSTIRKLFERRIVLDFTDHLSDRQLYCLIYRDILPSPEKKLDRGDNYLHWDCTGPGGDAEVWLRYYAGEDERQNWLETADSPLPPHEDPPYPRALPRRPL
ncbi:MAG TPA: hypothetical protein VHV55_13220 [Pirellulales bacterium]|jgi:hypothetical protein|nr:hypothetical protein [Pirellulales bacterium]